MRAISCRSGHRRHVAPRAIGVQFSGPTVASRAELTRGIDLSFPSPVRYVLCFATRPGDHVCVEVAGHTVHTCFQRLVAERRSLAQVCWGKSFRPMTATGFLCCRPRFLISKKYRGSIGSGVKRNKPFTHNRLMRPTRDDSRCPACHPCRFLHFVNDSGRGDDVRCAVT